MGLLDMQQGNGLMDFGMGLLNAGAPSRMPVGLGQAMGQGVNQMNAGNQQRQSMQMRDQQMQNQGVQLQQHQMQLEQAKKAIAENEVAKVKLGQYVQSLPDGPQKQMIIQHMQFGGNPKDLLDRLNPKKPDDYTINNQRFQGGTDKLLVTAQQKPEQEPEFIRLQRAYQSMPDGPQKAQLGQMLQAKSTPNTMNDYQRAQLAIEQQKLLDKPEKTATYIDPITLTPVSLPVSQGVGMMPYSPSSVKSLSDRKAKEVGATDVGSTVSTLRDAYDRLDSGGGIVNTKNSALSNAGAWLGSSGLGQALGGMVGTENQSARNDIAMTRPALLAALMKATGMSAKQMDSNAELKLWMTTATDPKLDVGANRRALDAIERKYLGNNVAPPPGGGKTATLSDIAATARASGRSTAEVTAAMKARGYTIGGE